MSLNSLVFHVPLNASLNFSEHSVFTPVHGIITVPTLQGYVRVKIHDSASTAERYYVSSLILCISSPSSKLYEVGLTIIISNWWQSLALLWTLTYSFYYSEFQMMKERKQRSICPPKVIELVSSRARNQNQGFPAPDPALSPL